MVNYWLYVGKWSIYFNYCVFYVVFFNKVVFLGFYVYFFDWYNYIGISDKFWYIVYRLYGVGCWSRYYYVVVDVCYFYIVFF